MAEHAEAHDAKEGHAAKHGHKGGGHGHGGGGHEEGHEGAPEWLISFADMVMLMMGFFVILFALNASPDDRKHTGGSDESTEQGSNPPASSMLDLTLSIREAFNNPVNINSTDPADAALVARLKEIAAMGNSVDPGVTGREERVQAPRPNDFYAVSGSIPFAEQSTDLFEQGKRTVRDVAARIKGMNLVVEVRAHASRAEAAGAPEHAMRLSLDRALAVSRELAAAGVEWWNLRLVLAGDHDRLNQHPQTGAADATNARVEIIVTDEVPPSRVPSGE